MAMRRPRIKAAPNLSVMRARGTAASSPTTKTTATANVPSKTGLPPRGLPARRLPPVSTVSTPKSSSPSVLAGRVASVLAPKSTDPIKSVLVPKTADITKPILAPKIADITIPVLAPKSTDTIKPVLVPKTADITKPVLAPKTAVTTKPVLTPNKIVAVKKLQTDATADLLNKISVLESVVDQEIDDANNDVDNTAALATNTNKDYEKGPKIVLEKDNVPCKTTSVTAVTLPVKQPASKEPLAVIKDIIKQPLAASNDVAEDILTKKDVTINPSSSSVMTATKEHSTANDEALTATNVAQSAKEADKVEDVHEEPSETSTRVPKLGQFVNGRYLATEKPSDKETVQPKKPIMRRFLGAKNKFKPNLFSRAQQMEVELNRSQKPGQLASLPEVNNPTRTRKYSSSGDETGANGGGRQRRNSNSSGGESTPPSKRSAAENKRTSPSKLNSPKAVNGQSSPPKQASTVENNPSDLDNSSLEVIDVSTGEKLRSGSSEDAALTAKAARMAAKSLLSAGSHHSREIVNGELVGRRRRSWSGSNSSGDELHRMNGNGKAGSKPARRRTAESKLVSDRTNFALKRRKIESKRRFSNGVPGRSTMTMFDLIYYNPDNGTEMHVEEEKSVEDVLEERGEENVHGSPRGSPRKDASVSPVKNDAVTPNNNNIPQDKQILDADIDEEPDDSCLPSVQVKVGANGEIIIDESSTMVETTASKRAKTDLANSTLVVENAGNKLTNYGTYSKKRKYSDWTERETFRFYRALSLVGSDFSMMETLFKKRNRHELKLKFKKEERINGALVDKCLRQRGQFTDLKSFIDEETDEDEGLDEKADRPTRGRRRQAAKSSRRGETRGRKISNRGMYESSSDGGEDADVSETSRSPAASRIRGYGGNSQQQPNQRRMNVNGTPDNTNNSGGRMSVMSGGSERRGTQTTGEHDSSNKTTSFVSIGASPLQKLPGVKFPPALLAANPGLAQATPGSLVVVASPSKGDPSSQLLHVYMVSNKKPKQTQPSITAGATPPTEQTSNNSTITTASHQNLVLPSRQREDTPTGGSGGSRDGTPTPGRSRSPTPTRRSGSGDPGRYSIDPAVVRAVDRKRTIADREGIYKRQRTLSEGSMISPSKLKSLSKASTSKYPDSLEAETYSRTRPLDDTSIDTLNLEKTTSDGAIVSLATSVSSLSTTSQSDTNSHMTSSSVDQPEDSNSMTSSNAGQSEAESIMTSSMTNQSEAGVVVARKSRPVIVSD